MESDPSTWWTDAMNYIIEAAYQLGHLLVGFSHDSDDSCVAECMLCDAIAVIDLEEMFFGGTATERVCQ